MTEVLDRECVEHRTFLKAMDAIAQKRPPTEHIGKLAQIAERKIANEDQ